VAELSLLQRPLLSLLPLFHVIQWSLLPPLLSVAVGVREAGGRECEAFRRQLQLLFRCPAQSQKELLLAGSVADRQCKGKMCQLGLPQGWSMPL
jgi:hypothetical protein